MTRGSALLACALCNAVLLRARRLADAGLSGGPHDANMQRGLSAWRHGPSCVDRIPKVSSTSVDSALADAELDDEAYDANMQRAVSINDVELPDAPASSSPAAAAADTSSSLQPGSGAAAGSKSSKGGVGVRFEEAAEADGDGGSDADRCVQSIEAVSVAD